jgi:hypothetical protein
MIEPGLAGSLPAPLCLKCRTGIYERTAKQEQPKETTIVIGAPPTPAEILGRHLYGLGA